MTSFSLAMSEFLVPFEVHLERTNSGSGVPTHTGRGQTHSRGTKLNNDDMVMRIDNHSSHPPRGDNIGLYKSNPQTKNNDWFTGFNAFYSFGGRETLQTIDFVGPEGEQTRSKAIFHLSVRVRDKTLDDLTTMTLFLSKTDRESVGSQITFDVKSQHRQPDYQIYQYVGVPCVEVTVVLKPVKFKCNAAKDLWYNGMERFAGRPVYLTLREPWKFKTSTTGFEMKLQLNGKGNEPTHWTLNGKRSVDTKNHPYPSATWHTQKGKLVLELFGLEYQLTLTPPITLRNMAH